MADWLERLIGSEPGFEADLLNRYTRRLLELARRQLPAAVRRRVDPEDVVQSVYRSFFQRLREGRFSFEESGDVWRLLAAMTFQKARRAGQFHRQQCRDVRRERPLVSHGDSTGHPAEPADPAPGPQDLAMLFESLEQLVARLPESYREIAVLRLQGASLDEIAEQVKRSHRTVFRALAELEKIAVGLVESSS